MNLAESIDAEIGTPPPPAFDLETLIRHGLRRHTRARRIGIGAGVVVSVAIAASIVFASSAPHPAAEPTATTTPSPPPTTPILLPTGSWPLIPLPTGSWSPIPLPTGVPQSANAILARVGPSLGVPPGTRFRYHDWGHDNRGVDASWGPSSSWGAIMLARANDVSTEIYSCALYGDCIEVTGVDGSMTYVAGPIVARESKVSGYPLTAAHAPPPTNHVFSYHPDGTFVMINIVPTHAPATLTVEQLVAAGQAFSLVS